MADKLVRVRECDLPACLTPEDDVKRVEVTVDKHTCVADVCAGHRATVSIDELLKYARKKGRRRGIRVTRPEDIPRG